MRVRSLGSQGPEISVIGYGGWEAGGESWGSNPSDDRVIEAMRAGFDFGINWVDTAEVYGSGRSEELIGRALQNHPDVLVFTKVASAPRGTGYKAPDIRKAVEQSLRRLSREVIDVYQLHWPDPSVPLEETWTAMGELVDAGLVRWIGVSNFTEDLIARCEAIRHVDSMQPQLSMLWQERLPLLDVCKRNGTGVITYGPLAYGLLTGTIDGHTSFPDDDWRSGKHGLRAYGQLFAPERLAANLDVVGLLKPIAERVGVTLTQLALTWVLHQEGATGAIVGSRSSQHMRENVEASTVRLSPDRLHEIDRCLEARGEVLVP